MKSAPSAAVARAIASSNSAKTTDEDRLDVIRAKAREARTLELELAALGEIQKEKSDRLRSIYSDQLPSMLEEAGIDQIGLPREGNNPGIDFELYPYYSASIAASWPPERRDAAFVLLKKLKAESLIKTEISTKLPKGSLPLAKKIVSAIKKLGASAELKQSVHSGTLSAWLREFYTTREKTLSQSDLEKIGASVGRVVRPKERE